jgi:DNA-binding NarL/FixJ family response regulator
MEGEIKVVVVDDAELATTLEITVGTRVVNAPHPRGAADMIRKGGARVAVVDLDRPGGPGVIAAIRGANRQANVLGVTEEGSALVAALVLGAGGCGFAKPRAGLRSAIDRAAAGELVLPASDLAAALSRLPRPVTAADRLGSLSPRETEILRSLASGLSIAQVSMALRITPQTVQSHIKNILAKLGVHSKVEAVTLAWRAGLGSSARTA